MKIQFTYVRHGETLFNQIQRMQGSCDSPLTADGIAQTENTASVLRDQTFDHIFCSSSERAWDTAKIIARYHEAEPICIKELKEFDFGSFDGEMIPENNDQVQLHRIADDWTDVGGENCELFKQRAERAFAKILPSCKDNDHVLIVSHGSYFSHLMKTMFTDCDQKEYIERRKRQNLPFVPNCSISEFEYEDGIYRLKREPTEADDYRKEQKKKVTFYFVRHGETVFNTQWRMQGVCDAELTEEGIRQAEKRREDFRSLHFDSAYVSTAERARDTAAILLEPHQITPVYEKKLREINFGTYEGSRINEHGEELMGRFMNTHFEDLGGESRRDVYRRLKAVLAEIIDGSKDNDTVLLVSHGGLYLSLMNLLFDLDGEKLRKRAGDRNPTPNLGYAIFTYENGSFTLKKTMDEENTAENPKNSALI